MLTLAVVVLVVTVVFCLLHTITNKNKDIYELEQRNLQLTQGLQAALEQVDALDRMIAEKKEHVSSIRIVA